MAATLVRLNSDSSTGIEAVDAFGRWGVAGALGRVDGVASIAGSAVGGRSAAV